MSTNLDSRPFEPTAPPTADLAKTMQGFKSPLAASQIAQSIRQTSSLETMEFFWHCAAPINNRAQNKGARGDTYYSELPRMDLIPLFAWPVPVIRARNAAFSIGRFTEHGASLGPTGVVVTNRSMLSHESATLFEKWYGPIGGLVLPSLTTEADSGKAEALLLYNAIMNNVRPSEEGERERVPGCETVIEDLPEFLDKEAPLLLDHCIRHGVEIKASEYWPKYPAGRFNLAERCRGKGEALILDLKRNVDATINHVMNEENGVLIVSRGQIAQAVAGVKDSKSRPDRRDEFYLKQFPSFSMNSPEERAVRASQPTVRAIESLAAQRSENEGVVAQALLESLEELKAMRIEAAAREEQNTKRLNDLEARLAANQATQ